ncbi:MAG: hypothetical protein ACR2KN_02095 [Geodermatophilaceae bacterium]
MSAWSLAVMIMLVAAMGTVGGGATRYERHGPAQQRGPAGAIAVISLTLAVVVALTTFAVATLQADGLAWRLVGVSAAAGLFGGLVAARGVDHYLVLRSSRHAVHAVAGDFRTGGRIVSVLLRRVPWHSVAAAVGGRAAPLDRQGPAGS